EDIMWKDPKSRDKARISMKDNVIGDMDRAFKTKLYRLCRALDDAGFVPGMTSGFRDDYRQSIASGNKAATNRSYHGGSLRGGYGHGAAYLGVSAAQHCFHVAAKTGAGNAIIVLVRLQLGFKLDTFVVELAKRVFQALQPFQVFVRARLTNLRFRQVGGPSSRLCSYDAPVLFVNS